MRAKRYPLTEFHKQNIVKMIEAMGIDPQEVDFEAIWDSSLQPAKNYELIQEVISGLNPEKKLEESYQEDEAQYYEQKALEEERKRIQEEVNREFQKILRSESSDLKKYFFCLERYIETILKSKHIHSLFITGKAGIGKSFTTIKTLSKNGCDFKTILGNVSPLELFHSLYDWRKAVLVFDDTQGLINNKASMSILMSALWNPTNKRIVSWLTTSKKLKCPEEFEFEGKIIFIANEIPDNIKPIVSRCMEYELNFNYYEILKIMAEISKQPHPTLTKEERAMIFNWIRENTDETCENFDLRLQNKIETLYEYNKENWKELASKLIKRNEDLALLKQLIESHKSVKAMEKEFIELTGKSRITFFRLKKALLTGGKVDWGNK